MKYSRTFCKACADPSMRTGLCPLCGGLGDKSYLEMVAQQLYEEYFDRLADHEQFGTPLPLIN